MKTSVESVLDMDCNPYTQNHYLYENIKKKRNERLKRRAMKWLVGEDAIPRKTAREIVNNVFDSNDNMSIQDHVAEEMEVVLDAYGECLSVFGVRVIVLWGWGIIGHWVTHWEALVLLYHLSSSQHHPNTITH